LYSSTSPRLLCIILIRIESNISKRSEHSTENKTVCAIKWKQNTPINCPLLTYSYRKKAGLTLEIYVSLAENRQHALCTVQRYRKQNNQVKKMHHHNYYLKLIGKRILIKYSIQIVTYPLALPFSILLLNTAEQLILII